jgi:hypothetical protein
MDEKVFKEFIKTSNAKLDALTAEKAAEDERWFKISTRYIEV